MGDSIVWGQGLNRDDKTCYKVARKLGLDIDHDVVNLAHSGATAIARGTPCAPLITDPDYWSKNDDVTGELPRANPTILEQAMFYDRDNDAVRYVLIDGSINDVHFLNILNPLFSEKQLLGLIEQHCHREMAVLLKYVAAKFSNADCMIAAIGYFPILSSKSNLLDALSFLFTLLQKHGLPPAPYWTKRDVLPDPAKLALEFWHQSDKALKKAVAEVGDRRLKFVPSGFSEDDALFTGKHFLREPELVPGHMLDPVDDKRYQERVPVCAKFENELYPLSDPWHGLDCRDASLGHPTELGADCYLDQIMTFFK
jgi:hypothetical protein